MFLKRIRYDGVTLPQLYLGNTIMVYSRQLKITEYGDDFTRSRLEAKAERCALPPPFSCHPSLLPPPPPPPPAAARALSLSLPLTRPPARRRRPFPSYARAAGRWR